MQVELSRFGTVESVRYRRALADALPDAPTAESAARALCRGLQNDLRGPLGEPACAMVRCYTTHPYGSLPADLQRFAKRAFGAVAVTPPEPTMRCLVLLATAGLEPRWNDRRHSVGHQAIPLPSPHVVERAPMIAQLVRELGLDLADVVRPTLGLVRDRPAAGQGIFHVEEALRSPYIPAQDFVVRYGVRSVLGFGGLLPSGELGAAILFARVPIPVEVADRFGELAAEMCRGLGGAGRPTFDTATIAERM